MDPEIKIIRELMASRPRATEIAQMRADSDARGAELAKKANRQVKAEKVSANGVDAEWLTTPDVSADKAILYLHGGGYVIGSIESHRHFAAEAGRQAGARTLIINYRMAPEHPFPAAVDDTVAAYRYLLDSGIAAKNICIAGDSAGGGLVVGALLAIKDAKLPLPGCGWCISPWVDMEALGQSFADRAATDPQVQKATIQFMAQTYLNGADPRHAYAAPIYGDLRGLPPLMIQVGSIETLLDDSLQLARKCALDDVPATLEVWPEMVHIWHIWFPMLTAGQRALESGGAFVRNALRGN
jgi:monoterpene epsilon-lactone hydrolase